MLARIKQVILGNLVIRGSIIVFLGSSIANLAAYLFHLAMGRMLGPADYGVLASLISLSSFLSIPVAVLGIILVKFVSQTVNQREKAGLFVSQIIKKSLVFGLLGLLLFFLAHPLLKDLVKISSFFPFLAVGLTFYWGIFMVITTSALQGAMEFFSLSFLTAFGSLMKLLIAFGLVWLGFGVNGAVSALAWSVLLTAILGYFFLGRKLTINYRKQIKIQDYFEKINEYALMIFLSNLALTSFFTVDVILARYFLSPLAAGGYAALSILGKVIFLASSSIVSVMFPLVSSRQAEGRNYAKILKLSFFLVFIASVVISFAYFLSPRLIIQVPFGEKYLEFAPNLGLFAVFISLYSLCSLLINFFLSISYLKAIFLPVVAAILQVILVCFYHQRISQIVIANIITMSLLLLGLLLFYFKSLSLKKEI